MGPSFDQLLWGKHVAYVRDTNDPERRGRIRCFCPDAMGEMDDAEHWLGWAEACLPAHPIGQAMDYAVPLSKADAGQEQPVWVEFRFGQTDFPIWTGMAVFAPTTKDPSLVKAAVSSQTGVVGGNLVNEAANAGPGSTAGSMDPPYVAPDQRDIPIIAKPGQRIVIMAEGGASIIIDGPVIEMSGFIVRINGREFGLATLTDIVG